MSFQRRTLRGFLRKITPRFLSGYFGTRVLHTLGLVNDALTERVLLGIAARFPDRAPDDAALGAIGRDRRIIRGFDESATSYAERLKVWLTDWRRAGHAYAVMNQIAGYLSPHSVQIRIVTNTGVWYTRASDGTESRTATSPNNWDWDGDTTVSWSRFWVIIYPPVDGSLWGEERTDAGTYGDGHSIGFSTDVQKAANTIRRIIQEWKPAHSQCEWILISFDWDEYDPTDAPAIPDGEWGPWHDKTTSAPASPSRDSGTRYWFGTNAS